MSEPDPGLQKALRWLRFAEHDLNVPRQLLRGDPRSPRHVRWNSIALEFRQPGMSGAQCRSAERMAIANHDRGGKVIDPPTDGPGAPRAEQLHKRIRATRRLAERLAADQLGRLGALKWL